MGTWDIWPDVPGPHDVFTAHRIPGRGRNPPHLQPLRSPYSRKGIVRAGAAFHEAVAGLARPDFLDRREDPWTLADQIAWDEQAVAVAYQPAIDLAISCTR